LRPWNEWGGVYDFMAYTCWMVLTSNWKLAAPDAVLNRSSSVVTYNKAIMYERGCGWEGATLADQAAAASNLSYSFSWVNAASLLDPRLNPGMREEVERWVSDGCHTKPLRNSSACRMHPSREALGLRDHFLTFHVDRWRNYDLKGQAGAERYEGLASICLR